MEQESKYGYDETVARLSKAIVDAGNTIFDSIDQAKAAEGVGMKLRPTTLIVFGNPKGGTPLMDAHPLFALELPLKILVWEDAEKTKVAYASMAEVAKRYGIDGDPRIANMDKALDTLRNAVT
ncbi:MAG TPA: DUF302 domain-containing protein [Candidatus Acidoferrales bacterium]|nr:DUF302 domain-containing protein [Candidatus Acidoferrales bacterium]